MLARRALCRLAVRALPLLTRSPALASARASPAVPLLTRCSYATKPSDTESTETVKKAVKARAKAADDKAPKKPAATKPAIKKPATKKTAATKAAPKKAKKKAVKKKPAKFGRPSNVKVLTPEEQVREKYAELRKLALVEPEGRRSFSTHSYFISNFVKGTKNPDRSTVLAEAGAKYNALTPAEREHYNHLTREFNDERAAKYRAWVESHTPDQIRILNNVRARLRSLIKNSPVKLQKPRNMHPIKDDRRILLPRCSWVMFCSERRASGDLESIDVMEISKLLASEWKALSDDEKKPYQDRAKADLERYRREQAELNAKHSAEA